MLNNLTVKARLFYLIGLMSLFAILLSVCGLYGMKQANNGLRTVYIDRTVPLGDLSEIKTNLLHTRTAIATSFSFPKEASEQLKKVEKNMSDIDKLWNIYMATHLTSEEKILADKFAIDYQKFAKNLKNDLALQRTGDEQEAKDFYFENVRFSYKACAEGVDALIQLQQDVAKQEYEAAENLYKTILTITIAVLSVGLGISIFIGVTLVSRLMNELGGEPSYAASIVNEVANGNLSVHVNLQTGDKSSLLYSINKMSNMLQSIIQDTNIVMNEAANGKLTTRIKSDARGDFIHLKDAINKSLDNIEETLIDVMRVADALSNGDLNQKITKEYSGSFGQAKNVINHTVDELHKIIEEVDSIVYSGADCGDFSVKMSMYGKVGYGKRLAELINQLFATTEKSLNDVLRVAESLADGDLTQHIEDDYVGAFASVKIGMNTTVENLKSLIGEVKATSEVIANASREISAGNHDLSHRTEEQAASLEETAASMEELAATVQANTENAKHANELAVDASKTAQKGVEVVNNVVSTMVSINESSHRIVDIVSVIDDIAFQTNILALNAAVEAARAGEQGKGFAVVAVEVRNLAQRAANAAGEVKQLISESVDRINGGSKQVAQAGKTMEDIVEAIQEVATIVSGITIASIEQNEGIDQVHEAVVQMDGVTQQNAALVEEAAAAAESLSEQTRNLATEMAHFKTEKNEEKSFSVDVKKAQLMQQNGAIIIDVRDQNEWDSGYIAGAIHIPLNEIKQRISELSNYKNHSLILQCRSGGRSMKAIEILRNAGFNKLYNMTGGLTAWTKMGFSLK